jgi:hypothetical protein
MKFIYEQEEDKTSTFGQVQDNQFFVDIDGDLCQKISSSSYCTIANSNGQPYATTYDCAYYYDTIKRILPKVTKIEF